MIKRVNITDFFEKYNRNIELGEVLNDTLTKARDEEEWIFNLREKSRRFRLLFIENEAMLNLYVRPFLEYENRLTAELADEFLKQLLELSQKGYCDRLVCVRLSKVLVHFFEEQGQWEKWMISVHMLGSFYSQFAGMEDAKEALACYDLERAAFEKYSGVDDWEVRRRILFAFYNYAVVLTNTNSDYKKSPDADREEYQKNIIRQVERAFEVYDNPKVRALDGRRYDLDELKQELLYDVYGSFICGSDEKSEMCPEVLENASRVMVHLYEQALQENENLYEMKDEIYCNYWKIQYYFGKIGVREYVYKIKDFCDYVLQNSTMDETEDYVDSRYFQVNMYQIPNLAGIGEIKEDEKLFREVEQYVLPQFKRFVRELPTSRRADFVNGPLMHTMMDLARNFGPEKIGIAFFQNVFVERNEELMMHSAVVKRIALTLLQKIFEKKPELLVGMFGTENVVDVLKNREVFVEFVTQAAAFYDIGKCNYAELIGMQSRRLEEEKKRRIHNHPKDGYELLKELKFPEEICQIALGHHKSYDGKSGYPKEFDHTKSPVRFFVDFFHICDCMGAATDTIGRIYNAPKSLPVFLQELSLGAGVLYHPDIAALILEDSALEEELSYLCSTGRIAMYYEAFDDFVRVRGQEELSQRAVRDAVETDTYPVESERAEFLEEMQKAGREQSQVLESLAKSTLLIARICMNEDLFEVVHHAGGSLFEGIREGSFRVFITEFAKERTHPQDYLKLKRLVEYGAFSDMLYSSDGNFELEVRLKEEKSWHWVRMLFITAEERNGVPQVIVMSVSDIDAAKRQQLQLQRAMELANKKAEQANRAKSEFFSNMSHDIRTPMNAILGMTQIAGRHLQEPQKVQDCLEKIEQASDHLLALINEVLDMSKIESGKMELEEKPVSLPKIVDEMLMLTQPQVEKKKLSRLVKTEGLPEELVYGDAVRIREILLNLMSNAVKYTPEGKWISFLAEKQKEQIGGYHSYHFRVEDGGIGMSKTFLKKLFEPFEREQTGNAGNFQGTGLGLSITKAFVEMMQGNIKVTSTPGEGSAFDVILRFRLAEENTQSRKEKKKITLEECLNRFAGKRILLAEDNELNRQIFMELIAETGVEIDAVENGKAAFEAVKTHPDGYYGMVFMDIQMPVMDGYEASGAIRQLEKEEGRGSRVPIIALTANVFAEDNDKAVNAGMDGHIGKPVGLSKILSVMLQWLEENGNGRQNERNFL